MVKLIIKKGDPYKLYSIYKDSYKSFIRSNNQCINLTAENIIEQILIRKKEQDNNRAYESFYQDKNLTNLNQHCGKIQYFIKILS